MGHRLTYLIPLIVLTCAVCLCAPRPTATADNAQRTLTILYSTDMQGAFEPCG